MSPSENSRSTVCIVVPVFNEAEVLPALWRRIEAVAAANERYAFNVVFVDDGSRDRTFAMLADLAARDSRISAIKLSRNFGKEAAMTAGLDHVDADWTVIIDADLQDPPELMSDMLRKAEEGYDVVFARRHERRGETWQRRFFAYAFYRLMGVLNPGFRLPADTGDYRVMSRRAVESVIRLRETHRFMKGIFAWIGYPSAEVLYDRDPRLEGSSKFSFLKLTNHAIDAITSFSTAPLRLATYLGLLVSAAAFIYGSVIVIRTLMLGNPVAGLPTLITSVMFLGGVQLLCLGIIGEYVGRIYGESKQRPVYLVDRIVRQPGTTVGVAQSSAETK